ncbi:DNA polymerase lambda isoform X7 [Macaca fascicularis]|uniref:DNA polymerase lambda isoform X5 n=1 Tax=Macaca mulatta TaxID=9544 RepID=UPI0000D9C476|nr:DNA polymerase lambda isoform X5 [Macaca mulatta]XP_015311359.1 DNA polymerase lambda isoform X5 [Macaca fascicularis]XP_028709309.1 DNA polymerase lambda isoform X5 [Macaca mulatta]
MDPRGILKAFPKRKKIHADASSKVLAKIPRKEEGEEAEEWLSSLRAHVVRTGIGRARAELFEKQIVQHGGQLCPVQGPGVTHIVVDEGMDYERALRLLRLPRLPPGAQLVKSAWLSLCLQERRLVDVAGFSIFIPSRYLDQSQPSKAEQDASLPPGTHEALLQTALPPPPSPTRPVSPPQKTKEAPNTQAQPISDDEASDGEETQEACSIPGIGKRMAEKIIEILESGHLRKLDHISESVPVLELFSNIWGAGTKTAQMWYQQGFRSLEDIRSQASLTTQQAIGLKHYNDFLERMPREEATEIEQTVQKAAQAFNSGLLCVACGSYRRGKATCGDVDVLITHPDGRSHRGIFSRLLDSLRQQGFLTDDLVSQEENGQQQKYLGVCRLPGPGWRHRRLDIIVVPYSEFACALLYFTGSAHFNRSMRALAKTKGMSLSEHALSTAVVRNTHGCKMGPGRVLPTPTEKDVFRLLGLPYREPAERDW